MVKINIDIEIGKKKQNARKAKSEKSPQTLDLSSSDLHTGGIGGCVMDNKVTSQIRVVVSVPLPSTSGR